MISTKITSVIDPLTFIQKESQLRVVFEYTSNEDLILGISGFSDEKIGRSSTKEVLKYSGLLNDPRVNQSNVSDSAIELLITKSIADKKETTTLRICAELIIKFTNMFIRRTYGTRMYVRKYHI